MGRLLQTIISCEDGSGGASSTKITPAPVRKHRDQPRDIESRETGPIWSRAPAGNLQRLSIGTLHLARHIFRRTGLPRRRPLVRFRCRRPAALIQAAAPDAGLIGTSHRFAPVSAFHPRLAAPAPFFLPHRITRPGFRFVRHGITSRCARSLLRSSVQWDAPCFSASCFLGSLLPTPQAKQNGPGHTGSLLG